MAATSKIRLLLTTSNIGSLFGDQSLAFQENWLSELQKLLIDKKPGFIALHLQEVGGKDYGKYVDEVDSFVKKLVAKLSANRYVKGRFFIDDAAESTSYTALGNLYLIHEDFQDASIYDFNHKIYIPVTDFSVETCKKPHSTKSEYSKARFSNATASRKGYLWTRWRVHRRCIDFTNVHLFHDACNITSCAQMPSVYSSKRREALVQTLSAISTLNDPGQEDIPLFIFGDFNFRLNIAKFIEDLTENTDKIIRRPSSDKSSNQQFDFKLRSTNEVLLRVGPKKFEYRHDLNGIKIQNYDWEASQYQNLYEAPISFAPSYPYAEDINKPTEFMGTRPPAYCDRVFMNKAAWTLAQVANNEVPLIYDSVAAASCVGDHKPVYLLVEIAAN